MMDCIIVGYNDPDFAEYVRMVRGMGARSGAYRDLDLAFINMDGEPVRALDVFNQLGVVDGYGDGRTYHNMELLWPTITYLGSYLARRGYSFDYVNLFQEEKEAFRAHLEARPRSVAITTTLYVSPEPIVEIVQFVRAVAPDTTVIVGGPFVASHAQQLPDSALGDVFDAIGADVYVINSEGEYALTQVLDALRAGSSLHGIANVAFRDGRRFVFNAREPERNALDANMVDYSLFPSLGHFTSLRTAKSCPFSCAFCGFPARAGRYTYLPIDLVEKELDGIREHTSVTNLTFLDDTFNVPKGRFKDILRLMIRRDYGFRWNSFYRSDHGDDETIELMAGAGCEGVFLGMESGSDAMLERMNKSARRKDYRRAIRRLREVGVVTHANVIVGFPGETPETVAETRELIEETQPDFYRAQLWYADPVTPVWSQREQLGIVGGMFNWRHHTMDAETAADLVDDLFTDLRGSTWLPQNGFELWSVFYLQRRGMSLAQVKRFVQAFNDGVAEKLRRPGGAELDAGTRAALERACHIAPVG